MPTDLCASHCTTKGSSWASRAARELIWHAPVHISRPSRWHLDSLILLPPRFTCRVPGFLVFKVGLRDRCSLTRVPAILICWHILHMCVQSVFCRISERDSTHTYTHTCWYYYWQNNNNLANNIMSAPKLNSDLNNEKEIYWKKIKKKPEHSDYSNENVLKWPKWSDPSIFVRTFGRHKDINTWCIHTHTRFSMYMAFFCCCSGSNNVIQVAFSEPPVILRSPHSS